MGLLNDCKNFALFFSTWLWSPYDGSYEPQRPLVPGHVKPVNGLGSFYDHAPRFPAPNGPEGGDFVCKYPLMGKEWTDCSTPGDRSCWLKGPNGKRFDINTDYDKEWPTGITREYYLEVNEMTINGDGIPNPNGKVFNTSYPGPWIKACWGDTLKITVKNNLKYNGTTIHWHGFRQLGTPEMDGVNGISQCPIPPGSKDGYTYTYTINATQYGTSWAHSHYSLQYADGLVAPITIFGPSAADYDEALDPFLITDWNHRSAFEDWDQQLRPDPGFPTMNSMLLNGKGNFAGNFPEKKFNTTVVRGKKYLLRIINTSVDTTWVFSIDNHDFTVISSDFVPITPYLTNNLTVGIGQRYHIILEAKPVSYPKTPLPTGDSFWIRTIAATGCKGFEPGNEPDERQGILFYNGSDSTPTTYRPDFDKLCRDEPFENLKPIVKWNITPFDMCSQDPPFDIRKTMSLANRPAEGNHFIWWSLGDVPMWLNFSGPSILNLGATYWDDHAVVIPQDTAADAWVYMAITAPPRPPPGKRGGFFPVAHPMHLHGHDFALIAQGNDSSQMKTTPMKFDNPPRRDVVLVPAGGFAVIAFKADNPGNWLLHCHIPWHASAGLAMQILEREGDLQKMMNASNDARLKPIRENCAKWDRWVSDKKNLWDNGKHPFQDDSGI